LKAQNETYVQNLQLAAKYHKSSTVLFSGCSVYLQWH